MRKIKKVSSYAVLCIVSLISVFPLYWMISASTNNSTVKSVSISNDDLKIETEEGDMYGLCSFDDMLTIVELIKLYKGQNNIK